MAAAAMIRTTRGVVEEEVPAPPPPAPPQDCVAVSGRIGCFQEFAIFGFYLVSVACDGGLEIWFWPFCEVLQTPARKFG